MKILIIIGTRPEAIKMAPLIHVLMKNKNFKLKICITAQHREMLDQVLNIFKIQADYDLNIMKTKQNLTEITCRILQKIKPILISFKPNIVLVHGDTTTTMASALAAFYHNIDVGHIEAGLRTGNIKSPWPEEANRKIVTQLAMYHFAPTENAKKNLLNECIPLNRIIVTGNTIIDALFWIKKQFFNNIEIKNKLIKHYNFLNFKKKIILVTIHRRENYKNKIEHIYYAIERIANLNINDIQIVYPIHLNPYILQAVKKYLTNINNIFIIKPQNYLSFVYLMYNSYLILSDSGGIQEEATALGKPTLIMRNTTERPEALNAGTIDLVGTNTTNIIQSVNELLTNKNKYNNMCCSNNIFGTGKASYLIMNALHNIGKNHEFF